jgi:hypothetical protein
MKRSSPGTSPSAGLGSSGRVTTNGGILFADLLTGPDSRPAFGALYSACKSGLVG